MMGRRKRQNAVAAKTEHLETYIGPGTTFEGTLKSGGALRIDGRVEGFVFSDGDVLIGESGDVRANVTAHGAVIAGAVTGDVMVEGRLELRPTARVDGDVRAGSLVIESGAQFRGRSEVVEEDGSNDDEGGLTAPAKAADSVEPHDFTEVTAALRA